MFAAKKAEKGWIIEPMRAGLYGWTFTEPQAVAIVNALNYAYERGRKTLAGELRDLIGAQAEES